jgi:hypothetical protein
MGRAGGEQSTQGWAGENDGTTTGHASAASRSDATIHIHIVGKTSELGRVINACAVEATWSPFPCQEVEIKATLVGKINITGDKL